MTPPVVQPACAICGKPQLPAFKPFCSRRCADVDLHRWMAGVYAISAVGDDEEESARPDPESGRE